MSDLFDVSKEIILVTGASQGLGRQFARVLSAHGAAVALAARQTAKLKTLEDEIKAKGGRAAAVAMDVTDTVSIANAIDGQRYMRQRRIANTSVPTIVSASRISPSRRKPAAKAQ